MTYDFFLPGLIIDAFERNTNEFLIKWINDIQEKGLKVVNMLGCHDGIPLLDLKGLLTDEQIQKLIDIVVKRGGYVKNLHGKKNMYYQVNATYYSALGEDDSKLLPARAIRYSCQENPGMVPGSPCRKNDHAAVEKTGPPGHKEINRTNLKLEQASKELEKCCQQTAFSFEIQKQFPCIRF